MTFDPTTLEFSSEPLRLRDVHLIALLSQGLNPEILIELLSRREVTKNWTIADIWELDLGQTEELSRRLAESMVSSLPQRRSFVDRILGGLRDTNTDPK